MNEFEQESHECSSEQSKASICAYKTYTFLFIFEMTDRFAW